MAEMIKCTNPNCQLGKEPCPCGFLNGHKLSNGEQCNGGTCKTCEGAGFVDPESRDRVS